ncbi:MAG TPA: alpha/beta fold hydrolase [Hyphomicrobiaceae bacterium]|nr:alpha/beta fold hydrolase [Hyphomicrobiaceae bacterium]
MDRPALRFAEFVLDLDAAELRKNGTPVRMEPQVFDLIAFLASHPGRVLSKEDIVNGVWHGRAISDSAISTRINAARRALGDDGTAQRFIKTVHGRGFRFEVGTRVLPSSEPAEHEGAEQLGPVEVRYCRTRDGINVAYGETGNGAPLVKAASFVTHIQYDSEGILFRDWIRSFTRFSRYIRYDERGNGLSDWSIDDFSFDKMVTDLEAVVDELALGKFVLLGCSQGASVSIAYANRHPERVAGLIIFGGYAAGWRRSSDMKHRERREALLQLARVCWGDDNPTARQAYAALFYPDGTPEQHAEFMKLQRDTVTPENAFRIMSTFAEIDVRGLLPSIKVPTLVMHCKDDAVVPVSAGKEIASGIKGARFVLLEGRNHILQASDPGWQRFTSAIREFVHRHFGRGVRANEP